MKRSAAVLMLAASLAACSDDNISNPQSSPQFDIDVNDPRGELIVEVRYNSAFYDQSAPVADNDCQLLVDVNVPTWSGYAIGFCERTRTTVTSPGTYGSRPWIYDGYQYPTLVSNIPVVVTAGQTTRQVYEIASMTGILTGQVTVGGAPAKSPYSVCLSTGGCSSFPKGDGNFRLITKPGSGSGVIRNDLGTQIASFSYTAVQGQTVAISNVAATDPRGDLRVEVRYNGAFQNPQSPTADNDCQILVDVNVPRWSGYAIGYCERTRATTVVPGTYGSRPWIYDGYQYPTLVPNIPVVITDGQLTTQVYDIATMTGIVDGKILIDGVPGRSPFSVCLSTGGCTSFPRGDGTFKLITKPGAGTGVVRNNTGTTIGTFSYTAVQGQTVTVPDQSVTDPRGTLRVEVRYHGQYFNQQSPIADNDCQILVDVNVPTWSGYAIGFCEQTRTTMVVPGTYGSRPWIYDGYQYPTLVANIPVTIVNGQTTTQVYDVATMTSIVSGKVMVDGQPASSAYRVCLSTGGCSNFPRGNGTFKLITKPGPGTGAVFNNIGVRLNTFNYNSTVGKEEPIGTIGGDNTPPAIAALVSGTSGANGWYTSDVSVSFTVTDPESPDIAKTGCDAVTVTIDTHGQTFTCTAKSAGGTRSETVTIKRDATVPVISFAGNSATYAVNESVAITCAASDATAGLASSTCAAISGAAYEFAIGSNTFSANARDHAGNTAAHSVSFNVTVSTGSLCALTRSFISQNGIANALCQKLEAAGAAQQRGNAAAAAGQIAAYVNQVEAQSGKAIPADKAAILVRLAKIL